MKEAVAVHEVQALQELVSAYVVRHKEKIFSVFLRT